MKLKKAIMARVPENDTNIVDIGKGVIFFVASFRNTTSFNKNRLIENTSKVTNNQTPIRWKCQ